MIFEPFTIGDSMIHHLDPRPKLIVAVVFAFVVALLNTFQALTASLLFSLFLVVMARLNPRDVIRRLLAVNGINFLFWIILPLTFRGEALFHAGPFIITKEGLLMSARITLKMNAIVLVFIALVSTSSVATLGHALNRLHIPDKIIHLLLISYRYIFVIRQEYEKLIRAAKARCFRAGNNIHTYRTYAYLIGMLLVRASSRAERVHRAMLCRGFKGKFYCMDKFLISSMDLIWSVFMTTAILGLVILEWV